MEEKNKKWVWAAVGVAAVTIGFLYLRKRKKKKSASIADKKVSKKEMEDIPSAVEIEEGSVGFGSKGEDVKNVQRYINITCPSELKQLGIFPLEINGEWDEQTDKGAVACSSLKRNVIDEVTLKRIKRDLDNAKVQVS
jgi:LPXTG-motif cell wall-anchored protein